MSKDKAPAKDPAAAAAAPAGGGKKKLILIIVIALVVIGGGVGGWLFMAKGKTGADGKGAKHAEAAKAAEHAPAQYYKFDPAFVVNFGGPENSRFLQIQVEAMTRDPLVLEHIKANEPAIRNDLLLLFSAQTYEALMSAEGKEALRKSTAESVRKVMVREGAKPDAIEDVFFTSFVIQ
jgi:flagellar FliL protein